MEIKVTFQDGPIEAEIIAGEDEDYAKALERLADFVEGYEFQGTVPNSGEAEPTAGKTRERPKDTDSTTDPESNQSNSIFDQVDATENEIHRILKTGSAEDSDVKEYPEIIGNTEVIGTSKEERLLNGSVIILSVLDEMHGVSRVKTSDLKDALGNSGFDKDAWNNIGRTDNVDVYLNRKGKGASATTELRPPGKADAADHIQDLIDDHRTDTEDSDE